MKADFSSIHLVKNKTKFILCFIFLLLQLLTPITLLANAEGYSGYPAFLEKKLSADMEEALDKILGPRRYIVSIAITIRQEDRQIINKTLTPLKVTGNASELNKHTAIDSNDNESSEIDTSAQIYGFPNFLSPSMSTQETNEEIQAKIPVESRSTITEHVYYNERKTIRTIPRELIQRIKYTVIINEDETRIPGFKKDEIRKVLESIVNLNSARGDQLEIFYTTFADHLFDFNNLAFKIKWLGNLVAIPVWVLNLLISILAIVIGIILLIQVFKTIGSIITVLEDAVDKIPNKETDSFDNINQKEELESLRNIVSQDPKEIAEVLDEWTKNPDSPDTQGVEND